MLGAFLSVVTVVFLATSLIAIAQASMIKEPYYAAYGVSPISPNTVDKTVGVCRIRSGGVLRGAYDGPLGEGTMTAELIINLQNTVSGKGLVTFKNTLEITSGPYGAFALEGLTHFKYEAGALASGRTQLHGNSDLGPVTISAEKGFGPPKGIWENGWIIHP